MIQHESDIVQQVCSIGPQGIEVRGWLMLNLPRLENAVFILAGRPKLELARDLHKTFGKRLVEIELQPWLDEKHTLDYFNAVQKELPANRQDTLRQMTEDWRRVVHRYAGGHPLKVTLTIELLLRNLPLPEVFGDSIEEALQSTPEELAGILEQVEQELVDGLMEAGDETATAMRYMAVARKGMDARLLHHLLGDEWPEKRCRRVLRGLRRWSFVKARPRSSTLFLHDEMYDLLERHAPMPDRPQVAERIAEDYERQIKELRASGSMTARRRRRLQTLQVEQLYYKMLAHRKTGYDAYVRLAVEAVFTHETGFDMSLRDSLRDEMLRFFRTRSAPAIWQRVNRDSAVLWVERYNAMGLSDQAYQVASDILSSNHPDFQSGRNDPLFMAALWSGQGAALAMQGERLEEATQLLQDAIATLELVSSEEWNWARTLGSAYNTLGYICRVQIRYDPAIEAYVKAMFYLRQAKLQAHLADVEKNLAYVCGLVGREREALTLCDESIKLFRRANNRYGEGYSLNTLGIIHTDAEHFYRGYIYSRDALRIFRRLAHWRGIGLALHALGEATRKRAAFEHTLGEAEKLFREAEEYLEEVEAYLNEPLRLAYAHNELGCLYRDWAAARQWHGRDCDKLIKQAREHLLEAADVAGDEPKWHIHRADCYEDLARVEVMCGPEGYAEALNWLSQAEECIEPLYRITEEGIPVIQDPMQGYWVVLGKIELRRGHIVFAKECQKEDSDQALTPDYEPAIWHYVRATAYFEAFSPQAYELQIALDSMHTRLRRLSAHQLACLREHAEDVAGNYDLDITHFLNMFDSTLDAISLLSGGETP